jgi:non-ribosomal peptide synthetase component F
MSGQPEYLTECFWPGVGAAELRELDERARAAAADITAAGQPVQYLGSLLMREDEVVLCLFAGSPDAVRAAAEQAEVPFDRIVEAGRTPWSVTETK